MGILAVGWSGGEEIRATSQMWNVTRRVLRRGPNVILKVETEK